MCLETILNAFSSISSQGSSPRARRANSNVICSLRNHLLPTLIYFGDSSPVSWTAGIVLRWSPHLSRPCPNPSFRSPARASFLRFYSAISLLSVLGSLTPPPGSCEHQECIWYINIHTCRQNTLIHTKSIKM